MGENMPTIPPLFFIRDARVSRIAPQTQTMSDTALAVANALYKIGNLFVVVVSDSLRNADIGLACGNTDLRASTQLTGDRTLRNSCLLLTSPTTSIAHYTLEERSDKSGINHRNRWNSHSIERTYRCRCISRSRRLCCKWQRPFCPSRDYSERSRK